MSSLVDKDLKVRYKRSMLGFSWSLLKPVFSMVVYTIVFTKIIRFGGSIEHFSLFLLTGLLPWNFFSSSISASTTSLLDNHRLIRSVYFPRAALPAAGVAANSVHLLLSLVVLELVLIIFGHTPGPSLILLPVVLVLFVLMTTGFALFFSVCNVFYRDVAQFLEVLLLAWFYASPVIYPLGQGLIPSGFENVIRFNPVAGVLEIFHAIFYRGTWPADWCWLSILVWTGVVFSCGLLLFHRAEPTVVKEL
jgi:ABC-type polysaccharide/polyol phosphate export permease